MLRILTKSDLRIIHDGVGVNNCTDFGHLLRFITPVLLPYDTPFKIIIRVTRPHVDEDQISVGTKLCIRVLSNFYTYLCFFSTKLKLRYLTVLQKNHTTESRLVRAYTCKQIYKKYLLKQHVRYEYLF